MFVTTYGWYRGRPTYFYSFGVFTVIWALTVVAAAYSLVQERNHPRTGFLFDPSDPLQLMVAASGGGLEALGGLENIRKNEDVRVRFLDSRGVARDDAAGESQSSPAMRFTVEPVSGDAGQSPR